MDAYYFISFFCWQVPRIVRILHREHNIPVCVARPLLHIFFLFSTEVQAQGFGQVGQELWHCRALTLCSIHSLSKKNFFLNFRAGHKLTILLSLPLRSWDYRRHMPLFFFFASMNILQHQGEFLVWWLSSSGIYLNLTKEWSFKQCQFDCCLLSPIGTGRTSAVDIWELQCFVPSAARCRAIQRLPDFVTGSLSFTVASENSWAWFTMQSFPRSPWWPGQWAASGNQRFRGWTLTWRLTWRHCSL